MSDVVLAARDLHKTYVVGGRPLPVLDGVDLDLHSGEILAIVGASGAGKSTLLHLLGLLDRPTRGRVLFRGDDAGSRSRRERARIRRRHIGFVFQFYHLVPELTAFENVLLARMLDKSPLAWMRGRKSEHAVVRDLLVTLGLGERMTHRPSQLSGGERQRVAIARALVSDPDVVLCDEPTGNLDERTSNDISELLFDLKHRTGKTFVWVTHDTDLAQRADRVLRLHHGRIEEEEKALS